MRLTDILKPEQIKVPLASKEKKAAINELVDVLVQAQLIKDAGLVLASVLEREATRTTGVGHGLAIPHSKCAGVSKLSMAIGKPREPIDFQSIDGQPVFVIVLLVSPPEQTGAHIQCLAHQPADDCGRLPESAPSSQNRRRSLRRNRGAGKTARSRGNVI